MPDFYSFNLPEILKRNTIVALRLPKFLAWVKNLTHPVNDINEQFAYLRKEIAEEYKFNGLKHSLEWLMNDTYDPINRGIYIDVHDQPAIYFASEAFQLPPINSVYSYELNAVYSHELNGYYALTAEEFNDVANNQYEFTVMVPINVPINVPEAYSLLDKYRFAGLRPRIVHFDGDEIIEFDYNPFNIN